MCWEKVYERKEENECVVEHTRGDREKKRKGGCVCSVGKCIKMVTFCGLHEREDNLV